MSVNIDWPQLWTHLARIAAAALLALPIAWQREYTTRTMGLRTFPLVAVATCGYVLLALEVIGPAEEAQARIIQGLMTGMGFIGGGAILKGEEGVRGTATAAGIWATGAVGAAVAYGQAAVAVVISAATFLILLLLTPVERVAGKDDRAETKRE